MLICSVRKERQLFLKHPMELIFKNYFQHISNNLSVKTPLNYSPRNFTCKNFRFQVYICFHQVWVCRKELPLILSTSKHCTCRFSGMQTHARITSSPDFLFMMTKPDAAPEEAFHENKHLQESKDLKIQILNFVLPSICDPGSFHVPKVASCKGFLEK